MGSDDCVVCSRKVTTRQHALQCDKCSFWQHRVCNTGISQQEYRQMIRSDVSINFTCARCKEKENEEETLNGPAHSTRIEESGDVEAEYGHFNFNLSDISSGAHNRTFTVEPDETVDPLPNLTPPEPDETVDPLPNLTPPEPDETVDPLPNLTPPEPDETVDPLPNLAPPEQNLTVTFDVPHMEDDGHSEIAEQSIQDPDLPDTILPDVPVTYTLVENGSQRKNAKLVSSDGYEYTKKSSQGNFTYWRCSKRSKTINCPATVSQKGEVFKINSREHIHPADKGALKKTLCRGEVKSAALQDIHKPARRIVEDALLEHITPEDHDLPKVCNLRRMANQVRADKRPEEPKDLDFDIDIEYLQCEEFLIGDLRLDDQRHLMFATPAQLRLLRYALRWYCDGTFKVTPQPFTQLWSIHAFIRRGDSNKQVPLLFVLMSRRKTRDYIGVLQKLKEVLGVEPEVEEFVSDFEKGVWKAIRDVFPTASIKGCVFHFTQAVWRKTQELGLKTTYSQRGAEYRYIRMLMALPFLPSHDIEPAFQLLSDRATSPELRSLVRYMENTWMDNAVWRPRNWSIYRQSIRTNNDVEGYHTRINADVRRAHMSFYIVLPALKREANLVELTYRLVSEEQILRDQRQKQKRMEGRLHQCWQEYERGTRTASQLLSECGKIYGPSND